MYFSDPADIMLEREQQAAALSVALLDLTLVYREALAQAKKEKIYWIFRRGARSIIRSDQRR